MSASRITRRGALATIAAATLPAAAKAEPDPIFAAID
jgi:hypothetical protein